jgi:hypothetical protein
MKIETIKKEETWYVLDNGERFSSEKDAEARQKDIEKYKEERLEDYLICGILFDYIWINYCGANYMVPKYAIKDFHLTSEDLKFNDNLEVSEWYDPQYTPPRFGEQKNFLDLYTKIISKDGFCIDFYISNTGISCLCSITNTKNGKVYEGTYTSTSNNNFPPSKQYLIVKSLKKAAYNYCKCI